MLLLGWWWADPVAALVMVPIIAREGVQGLRGEGCDDCGVAEVCALEIMRRLHRGPSTPACRGGPPPLRMTTGGG